MNNGHGVACLILIVTIATSFGWTKIGLAEDTEQYETSYLDFSPDQRIEFRMTQYIDAVDLDFELVFQFFESDSRENYLAELMFNWNTKSGRQSIVSLYENTDFSTCFAVDTNLLNIPQIGLIELDTEYIVTLDNQHKGDYKSNCDETQSWQNWQEMKGKIQKLKIKLEDVKNSQSGYELADYFTIEYKIVQACSGGEFYSDDSCSPCEAGEYSPGGFTESCSACPEGKTVQSGQGTSVDNCTWENCSPGQYLNIDEGCLDCESGSYGSGGSDTTCTGCASGTFSTGKAAECTGCEAGTFSLANADECVQCEAGTFSLANADECTKCSTRYFSLKGAGSCTECPEEETSEEGSASCEKCPKGKTLNDDGVCSGAERWNGYISIITAITLLVL